MRYMFTVTRKEQVEVSAIRITIPVRYEEEDIPNDFPFRNGDTWSATITMDGRIVNWSDEHKAWFAKNTLMRMKGDYFLFHMKVCDTGQYELLAADGTVIVNVEDCYVPDGVIPGEYGDYVILHINADGKVLNWPKNPDFSEFDAAKAKEAE